MLLFRSTAVQYITSCFFPVSTHITTQAFDLAKKQGYVVLRGTGYRRERKGSPLLNIFRQFCDAKAMACTSVVTVRKQDLWVAMCARHHVCQININGDVHAFPPRHHFLWWYYVISICIRRISSLLGCLLLQLVQQHTAANKRLTVFCGGSLCSDTTGSRQASHLPHATTCILLYSTRGGICVRLTVTLGLSHHNGALPDRPCPPLRFSALREMLIIRTNVVARVLSLLCMYIQQCSPLED